jgi:hypothetical protein
MKKDTPRPPMNMAASVSEAASIIRSYDEKVSAVTEFEGRSSKIFHSDNGDGAWMEFCVASKPQSDLPSTSRCSSPECPQQFQRINYPHQLDDLTAVAEVAL